MSKPAKFLTIFLTTLIVCTSQAIAQENSATDETERAVQGTDTPGG